jgi:hypothetical protein
MSETVDIPPLPDTCWPVDWGCVDGHEDINPVVKARAEALAVSTLRALVGYRVGGCPVLVRPCAPPFPLRTYAHVTGGFTPYVAGGAWLNASCGCASTCGCTSFTALSLPPPVGAVEEVVVDGEVLATTEYRLENGRLIRTTGTWPLRQDLSLPVTEVGTFGVRYLNAAPVDGLGAYAAGILAGEYVKACTGGKNCRLPAGVTTLSRQGVTMEIAPGAFPGGHTGIREVDAYIYLWNPNGLRQAPVVMSPDTRRY